MKNLTTRNLAAACGGTFHGNEDILDTEVTAVTADSRKVTEGCLFVPLAGEHADGHDFIPRVMQAGALLTLTEKEEAAGSFAHITVPSAAEAMRRIAAYYLKTLGTPVVSVTGSVGKTSTKEMIAFVLAQKYRTLKTLGNFNNDLGLPFTIFRLTPEDEIAVLEMGISHFGEMSVLASIAPPDTSVITNIGTCHLEFLKDRDGVFRAKTEVFRFLKKEGRAVLNGDDDKLAAVKEVNGRKPVFYGLDPGNDIWADEIKPLGLAGISCTIHVKEKTAEKASFAVTIPIPGKHMVYNALAGCAVGLLYGETTEEIKAGIESLEPLTGRFHITEHGGVRIIDDCYNANPMSMKASLSILQDAAGRRVAILGDMGELGENEKVLHREVGAFAAGLKLDLVLTAGPLAALLADEIRTRNPQIETISQADTAQLLKSLPQYIKKGDTVLVKASHFMHFEKIVAALNGTLDQ